MNIHILESIVDRFGMGPVLAELAVIAYAKAEHVQSQWHDAELAKRWEQVARVIERAETAPAIACLNNLEGRPS